MKKSFFEVLYYLKNGKFSDADDVRQSVQAAEAVDRAAMSERKQILVTWLSMNNMLNKQSITQMIHFCNPESKVNYQKLEAMVAKCYENVQNFEYQDEKKETYQTILQLAIATRGRFLDTKNQVVDLPDPDSKVFDDEQTDEFMLKLNEMKQKSEDEYSLEEIIELIYDNKLQEIQWSNISQTNKGTIYEPLAIFHYLVNCLKNSKKFEDIRHKLLYETLLNVGNYQSDGDFFSALKKADSGHVFDIDYTGLTNMIEKLQRSFEDKDIVATNINSALQKPETMNNVFGTVEGADSIEKYLQGVMDGSIKPVDDTDEKLNKLINTCIVQCREIEKELVEFTQKLNTEIKIDSVTLTLKDAIERWKSFYGSKLYKDYFEKELNNDIDEIVTELLQGMKEDDLKYVDTELFKTKSNAFQTVIQKMNVQKLEFEPLAEIAKGNPDRISLPGKVQTVIELLNFTQQILTSKVTLMTVDGANKAAKKPIPETNGNGDKDQPRLMQYWNAACTLIYLKDKNVQEAYQPETETMLFEDTVIMEATDWTKYFDNLDQMISQTINGNSNINNVFDYIKKSGTLSNSGDDVDNALAVQQLANAVETANQQASEVVNIFQTALKETMPKNPAEGQNIFEK